MMRTAEINRKTAETDIKLKLNLDGTGVSNINTGVGFLDHMLTLFSKHGRFDLVLKCKGDTEVDYHHSAEDIGIALGSAFSQALSDMKGIKRYADIIIPNDNKHDVAVDFLVAKIKDILNSSSILSIPILVTMAKSLNS